MIVGNKEAEGAKETMRDRRAKDKRKISFTKSCNKARRTFLKRDA